MSYTLVASGDVLIEHPFIRPDAEHLAKIWEVFRAADDTFVNLEGAVTNRQSRADKLQVCRIDPGLVPELAGAGITVLTVANNHACDFGLDGLQDTINAVTMAGVQVVGGGRDVVEALEPAVFTRSDRHVGFMGLACTLPTGSAADVARAGIAPIRVSTSFVIDPSLIDEQPGSAPYVETLLVREDLERVVARINDARQQLDLLVIAVHWGVVPGAVAAFQDELATYQQPLGHALVDAGADVIIGHHSHCLNGIEIYRGRPIFYGLGNLVFRFPTNRGRSFPPYSLEPSPWSRYGAFAELAWPDQGGVQNDALPISITMHPVIIDPSSGEPMLAVGQDADTAIRRIADHSVKFGTRFERHGDVLNVEVDSVGSETNNRADLISRSSSSSGIQ